MSIRSLHSPRIIAIFSTLVLVASLALPFASAQAALGDKCDNAYIMHCGYSTKSDWQKQYRNGDGTNSAANLKQIYTSQGVTEADMMSGDTVLGYVTRDSKVTVNGRVVASNVWSSGRSSLGFDNAVDMGNGVWFHPTGVTFASGVDKMPALVNMKGGTFKFAIMKSCGNIVKPMNKSFGLINKQVKDTTTNSQLVAADDAAHALGVNNGDTISYTVTVGNNGTSEMTNVVFTDELPSGLALASDTSNRHVERNLGTISAGGAKSIVIIVKAGASTNGQIVDNKACFTANNGQKGCDHAVIKVKVSTPTPAPTPQPVPAPVQEQSPMCVSLTAMPSADDNVHFIARAKSNGTVIQRYTINVSNGESNEEIAVVSSAESVTADRVFAPGSYTATLTVQTASGTARDAEMCRTDFSVITPPVGGGALPTPPATTPAPTQIPDTGAEGALGGLLGMGGLGYAARGYLRSRRGLIDTIKNNS